MNLNIIFLGIHLIRWLMYHPKASIMIGPLIPDRAKVSRDKAHNITIILVKQGPRCHIVNGMVKIILDHVARVWTYVIHVGNLAISCVAR